jgi:hypothetical protein
MPVSEIIPETLMIREPPAWSAESSAAAVVTVVAVPPVPPVVPPFCAAKPTGVPASTAGGAAAGCVAALDGSIE